ncbi:MAG: hypothetical protein WB760_14670 [Xanthobacteraceae bacterium]
MIIDTRRVACPYVGVLNDPAKPHIRIEQIFIARQPSKLLAKNAPSSSLLLNRNASSQRAAGKTWEFAAAAPLGPLNRRRTLTRDAEPLELKVTLAAGQTAAPAV